MNTNNEPIIIKRKPNHFLIFDKTTKNFKEIEYLSQKELASGYKQVVPRGHHFKAKKNIHLLNHFSVTLAFLPDYLWAKLRYEKDNYKTIRYGSTLYNILETNQDEIMINLYKEINNITPNIKILEYLINELDDSQYTSWLVIRSNYYINHNKIYEPEPVYKLNDYIRQEC